MNRTNCKSRLGTVLICVLACLGVVIAVIMATIQSSLRGRLEVRMQRQLFQTELLCEAGVQRAVNQLAESPGYQGEEWKPKLGIASFAYAAVKIRAEETAESPPSRMVEVIATVATSADSNDSMQRSHTFFINLPKPLATETRL